jgi:4-amino-4-deoxy-L-arabinose transferase-like glycosyltransferase
MTWYSHRPPVFPLLMSGVRFLFGFGIWPVYLMNAILGASTAVVVWRTGVRVFGQRIGLWAGVAFALWPFSIVWTAGVQPEVLCAFLVASCIWAVVAKRVLLVGITAGLLALTRSNYIALAPLLAVWMLGAGKARHVPLMLAAWSLTLVPWIVRNYVVHGQLMVASSDGGMAFVLYNDREMLRRQLAGESQQVDPMNTAYGRIAQELARLAEPAQTRLMYATGAEEIRAVPGLYARVVLQRFWLLWNPIPDTGGWIGKVMGVPLAAGLILAVAGLIVMWRDPARRPLALMLVGLAIFGTSVILVRGVSRYKAAIEPAVVLLAIAGVEAAAARILRALRMLPGSYR